MALVALWFLVLGAFVAVVVWYVKAVVEDITEGR
jgi:hypothetical protein